MPSNSKEFQERRRSWRLANIKRSKKHIVVSKVFIEYKNRNITKKALIKEFSSFGKIKDFSIIENIYKENICKVTFYDPKSADRLLGNRYININYSNIVVKPCPTWEQPIQDTSNDINESSTSNSTFNDQQYSEDILILNDYCLETIFNYLDLNSQLRFSFCHERLENIYINMICPRSIPKQLDIVDLLHSGKFYDWEIWQYIKTAGQHIEGIQMWNKSLINTLTKEEVETFKMIGEFCTNVQRFQLIRHSADDLRKQFCNYLNFNLLTEVELYNCHLQDQHLKILLKCENLTSLGLAQNPQLLGDPLPHFEKVQRLSVNNCKLITNANLIAACKKMKLKYLDIINASDQAGRTEALKYCPELETLKMFQPSGKDLEQVLLLENLKSLELNTCENFFALHIRSIFKQFSNKLEILKVYDLCFHLPPSINGNFCSLRTLWIGYTCYNRYALSPKIMQSISTLKELRELFLYSADLFTNMDFMPVIENCQKLERLCITSCRHLTNDFVYLSHQILEERKYNRATTSAAVSGKPLTIYLRNTGIKSFLIEGLNADIDNNILIVKSFLGPPLPGLLSNDVPFDLCPHALTTLDIRRYN